MAAPEPPHLTLVKVEDKKSSLIDAIQWMSKSNSTRPKLTQKLKPVSYCPGPGVMLLEGLYESRPPREYLGAIGLIVVSTLPVCANPFVRQHHIGCSRPSGNQKRLLTW